MTRAINYADPDGTAQVGYGVFVSQDGLVWRNATAVGLEGYAAGHFADYGVAAAEYGVSGLYHVDFPSALPAGVYDAFIRRKVGGSYAESDPVVYVAERVGWNGAGVVPGSIPASSPGLVTGYLYTYNENGVVEAGVQVTSQVAQFGGGASSVAAQTGFALDQAVRTATSDVNGLVSFPNLFKGVIYKFRRGTSVRDYSVEIPATATDPYTLPSIIGEP